MSLAGEPAEECVTLLSVWCLVGDRPDDDVAAVLVAADHVVELAAGIGEGVVVSPGDGPVDGNL